MMLKLDALPSDRMNLTYIYLPLLKSSKTKADCGFVFFCNHKVMHDLMGAKDRYICQHCISWCSLFLMNWSAWRNMYTSRDDQIMIPLTGFDFASFHFIVNLFAPKYNEYTPVVGWDGFILCKVSLTQGRPRLMNPADCLGLVLAWSRTQGSMMVIQWFLWLGISSLHREFLLKCSRLTLLPR